MNQYKSTSIYIKLFNHFFTAAQPALRIKSSGFPMRKGRSKSVATQPQPGKQDHFSMTCDIRIFKCLMWKKHTYYVISICFPIDFNVQMGSTCATRVPISQSLPATSLHQAGDPWCHAAPGWEASCDSPEQRRCRRRLAAGQHMLGEMRWRSGWWCIYGESMDNLWIIYG